MPAPVFLFAIFRGWRSAAAGRLPAMSYYSRYHSDAPILKQTNKKGPTKELDHSIVRGKKIIH
jgi:hypothetical protein